MEIVSFEQSQLKLIKWGSWELKLH